MTVDIEAAFHRCCAGHGVEPFHLDSFDLDGLTIFAEAALSAAARDRLDISPALKWIEDQLTARIVLRKRLRATPSLIDVPVPAPIFIVSAARTGSTLLHWLLSLEPSLRAPQLWELWDPMRSENETSSRQSLLGAQEAIKSFSPASLKLHPMAADKPDECHWLMRHSDVRGGMHMATQYGRWLADLDAAKLTTLFRDYRQQVQFLQAANPARTWLSKTPAHMIYWPVLFDVFPDARVIRLHRDPHRTLASGCSLFQQITRGGNLMVIGEDNLECTATGFDRMMAADETVPRAQVLDVMYDDLCGSPSTVARDIARWLGVADLEAFQSKVDRYLASAGHIRAAPNPAVLDDFGLTRRDVSQRLEAYIGWVRARLDPSFCL